MKEKLILGAIVLLLVSWLALDAERTSANGQNY
jgi:hypothetical protein